MNKQSLINEIKMLEEVIVELSNNKNVPNFDEIYLKKGLETLDETIRFLKCVINNLP